MTGQSAAYATIREKGWKIVCRPGPDQDGLRDVIADIIRHDSKALERLEELGSSRNARVAKFTARGKWYIFKEYLKRHATEYLKASLVGSRAKRAWDAGLRLMANGIGTPEVRAYGERIFFCIPAGNFLITDFLPDASGIYTFFRSYPSDPRDREAVLKKRTIIRDLGLFIGNLHARGIFHGDLRLDNILISASGAAGTAFFLIDNERNRFFPGGIPDRYRRKNLIQINMVVLPQITATDRLRFFHAYLDRNPSLRAARKTWMREVFSATKKRLQKKFPGIWGYGQ